MLPTNAFSRWQLQMSTRTFQVRVSFVTETFQSYKLVDLILLPRSFFFFHFSLRPFVFRTFLIAVNGYNAPSLTPFVFRTFLIALNGYNAPSLTSFVFRTLLIAVDGYNSPSSTPLTVDDRTKILVPTTIARVPS